MKNGALQLPKQTTATRSRPISIRWETTLEATVAPGYQLSGEIRLLDEVLVPSKAPIDSMMLPWKKFHGSMPARSMMA